MLEMICERFREVKCRPKTTQLWRELVPRALSPSDGLVNQVCECRERASVGGALIHGFCWFLWCKYSYCGQSQATNCVTRVPRFNIQLLSVGAGGPQHTNHTQAPRSLWSTPGLPGSVAGHCRASVT